MTALIQRLSCYHGEAGIPILHAPTTPPEPHPQTGGPPHAIASTRAADSQQDASPADVPSPPVQPSQNGIVLRSQTAVDIVVSECMSSNLALPLDTRPRAFLFLFPLFLPHPRPPATAESSADTSPHPVDAFMAEEEDKLKELLTKSAKKQQKAKRASATVSGTRKFQLVYAAGRSPPVLREMKKKQLKVAKEHPLPLLHVEEKQLRYGEEDKLSCSMAIVKLFSAKELGFEQRFVVAHPSDNVVKEFRKLKISKAEAIEPVRPRTRHSLADLSSSGEIRFGPFKRLGINF